MTIAIDSETPSSILFHYMQATTLMTIMITQKIAITLWSTFLVAINRMMNAKKIEDMIPFLALLTNASSVGSQGQTLLV